MSERLILLSNDDGVSARGLDVLRAALVSLGRVVVVAPASQQSASSHALTLHRPLRHREVQEDVHTVDGSPADCIYVAFYLDGFLPRMPDVVVSGINHGYNLGTDVYYSGTVAAAREGALRGVPAIAFSLGPKGSFDAAAKHACSLTERLLDAPGRSERGPSLLNVNFPPGERYRGVRATRIGQRTYADEVVVREDPRGHEYYWIGGPTASHQEIEGSDTTTVDAGYVSVTPLILDPSAPNDLGLAAWVAAIEEEDA